MIVFSRRIWPGQVTNLAPHATELGAAVCLNLGLLGVSVSKNKTLNISHEKKNQNSNQHCFGM